MAETYPSAGDIEVTGTFGVDGEITLDGERIRPRIKATLENARVASKSYDLEIAGITGSIMAVHFDPLFTPGNQTIKIAKTRIGKFELTDAFVSARLEGLNSLLIEQVQGVWAGGQLYSYAFRFDPAKPVISAVVYADGLAVGDLLTMIFSEGDVTGNGTLYGRLPIKIDWPKIDFGDGFLYATPGAGKLSLGKKAELVADMVQKSGGAGANAQIVGQVRTRILEALRNFRYDQIKTSFIRDRNGLVARIEAHGRGAEGPKPQELDLTVNVNGVDQAFNNLLVVKKVLSSIGTTPGKAK
jgi:hypothetical protein